MLVVAFVSFSLFHFVGDPINNMVGEETSDEERAELRETLGLMDPIYVQFSRFVVNASKGEFGISYQLRRPVSELITERYCSGGVNKGEACAEQGDDFCDFKINSNNDGHPASVVSLYENSLLPTV